MTDYNETEKNNIDLIDMLVVVWRYKFFIAAFAVLVSVLTVVYVIKLPNIYMSSAMLRATQTSNDDLSKYSGIASMAGINLKTTDTVTPFNVMRSILNDRNFLIGFVKKNNFTDVILDKKVPAENIDYAIFNKMRTSLFFAEDNKSKIMTLGFEHKNRETAKKITELLLMELSIHYKEFEMNSLQDQIDNFKVEIDRTADISVKNRLSDYISGLINKKVLANAQKYYGFDVIVEPSVPFSTEKVRPKRALICVSAFAFAVITGVFTSLLVHFTRMRLASRK